ncbi:MAG: 50S ribosomal protein L19 [Candidatus Aegiribacteria sp.]|nr:50S ribosomal protein L19 [Candidatus Aegiribacteria sp.]MBD3295705.1 50S ribosomal protein L19 [Candidatus Fermentibacteria bacterium]
MDDIIRNLEAEQIRDDLPEFKAGDTVKVHFMVREGDKVRTQLFQGIVIARRGSGLSETFTVRKISGGVSVERVFPVNSPLIDTVEITRVGKVRRGKLFYLRDKKGKAARIKEKKSYDTGQ